MMEYFFKTKDIKKCKKGKNGNKEMDIIEYRLIGHIFYLSRSIVENHHISHLKT